MLIRIISIHPINHIRIMLLEFARFCGKTLNNPYACGFMAWCLVFVPIIGMWAVHKYGWEHWEPFSRHEPPTPPTE